MNKQPASVPSARDDEHFRERHASFLKRAKEGPVGVLFLGDSITRRWQDFPDLWHQYFDRYQPANFGVGGDCTQNLLWRLENGELDHIDPAVVVLLIGTNNVPSTGAREIANAIRLIIRLIRKKLSGTRILLMAILPRGPQDPSQASVESPYYMDVISAVNRQIMRLDNGRTIRCLDIGRLFIGPGGSIDPSYMPDQVHLVAAGFKVWAESMGSLLQEMMQAGAR